MAFKATFNYRGQYADIRTYKTLEDLEKGINETLDRFHNRLNFERVDLELVE